MTYDVPRWDCPDVLTMELNPRGIWVLAADAEAHERAAVEAAVDAALTWANTRQDDYNQGREQAIRDCIAIAESYDAAFTAAALRALLEGSE